VPRSFAEHGQNDEQWLGPPDAKYLVSMESGTVALSPEFFANELKSYSDWRDAFWRELIQNSVDAGCRNINIRFQGIFDEPEVIFSDDGPGMSRETLRDVYFQLGASTKGADDIGGFGRARMLTCFAHSRYWVKSRDYLATGSGACFQIATNPDRFTGGCEIGVRLLNSGGDIAMKSRLISFLSTCQLNCRVMVEGEEFTSWAYRYRKLGELSFAAILQRLAYDISLAATNLSNRIRSEGLHRDSTTRCCLFLDNLSTAAYRFTQPNQNHSQRTAQFDVLRSNVGAIAREFSEFSERIVIERVDAATRESLHRLQQLAFQFLMEAGLLIQIVYRPEELISHQIIDRVDPRVERFAK